MLTVSMRMLLVTCTVFAASSALEAQRDESVGPRSRADSSFVQRKTMPVARVLGAAGGVFLGAIAGGFVGYNVLPEARGRGVASRALRLLSTWVLSPQGMDLERVQLDHAVENVASCRTADHAGFTREGVRQRFLPLQNSPKAPVVFHDTCLHGLVRS